VYNGETKEEHSVRNNNKSGKKKRENWWKNHELDVFHPLN
jgi:hypothetical protein